MIQVAANAGFTVQISKSDLEIVENFSSQRILVLKNNHNRHYAVVKRTEDGKQVTHLVARVILGLTNKKKIVSFKDGNPLNLQRSNMVIVDRAKAQLSRTLNANSTSGYKGVRQRGEKWQAGITVAGKYKYLGMFETPEIAAEEYNKAALKFVGKHATLNEIQKA